MSTLSYVIYNLGGGSKIKEASRVSARMNRKAYIPFIFCKNFIKIYFIRNALEHQFITAFILEVMWRPVRSEWSGTREGEKCV